MEDAKVVIAIPHLGNLPQFFVQSLLNLKDSPYAYVMIENEPVDIARNKCVEQMLELPKATHILFMDADMKFPPGTVSQLLKAQQPVVSGTYFARTDTPVPHVYDYTRTDANGAIWYTTKGKEFVEWMYSHPEQNDRANVSIFGEPELVACDAVGGGCLLIERRVLEDVHAANADSWYPWFECGAGSKGGEDFAFCERVRALGYPIYADFNLQCDHEAKGTFTGREEFGDCFGVGTEEEHDFALPMLVEVGPQGGRRVRPNPKVKA